MNYTSENTACPLLYLACADYAAHYRAASLNGADAQRARQKPSLHRHPDWRTSRALLALCADAPQRSVSHRKGCATVFAAGHAAGTDIEILRPRDFSVWQRLLFTHGEQAWLSGQDDFAAACYALWTLKESLVKAAGLQWADLARVGLCRRNGAWRLSDGRTLWQGGVWRLGADIIAAAVWPPHCPAPRVLPVGDARALPLSQPYRF